MKKKFKWNEMQKILGHNGSIDRVPYNLLCAPTGQYVDTLVYALCLVVCELIQIQEMNEHNKKREE